MLAGDNPARLAAFGALARFLDETERPEEAAQYRAQATGT